MRLAANDKVPEPARPYLRAMKAIKQGIELRGRSWWPALEALERGEQQQVRRFVADALVWQASLPRYTTDGRRYA